MQTQMNRQIIETEIDQASRFGYANARCHLTILR